jgi:hypothetical protein
MMLPILISVSVAPVSYFFCARAVVEAVANKASVAAATARRAPLTGIAFLPHVIVDGVCRGLLERKALLLDKSYHLGGTGSTESPCGKAAGAASLVADRHE